MFDFQFVIAQNVGINVSGALPDNSAMLDIDVSGLGANSKKGLLIPRVALSATNLTNPIPSPLTSLLVYNTATSGSTPNNVVPGYYYWDGTKWVALNGGGTSTGTDWSILGNAGTVDGTNFLGTTDAVPLNFRVANQKAGRIELFGSVFLGSQAGSNNNAGNPITGIGRESLLNNTSGANNSALGRATLYSNTTGNNNTAMGSNAMYNNSTGSNNEAIGASALYSNTTGGYNTAVGGGSMLLNTTGGNNVAFGGTSLGYNTTGDDNVAIGSNSLRSNSTGKENTITGSSSTYYNTAGSYNTANGYQALFRNLADYNTAMGHQAMLNTNTGLRNAAFGAWSFQANTTGSNNTAIGFSAFSTGANFSNSTALGFSSVITANNSIVCGNSSVTSIGGQVGWTTISDSRFKKDVTETVPGLAFITKLRPVTYHHNMDAIAAILNTPDNLRLKDAELLAGNMLRTGFIAQEVEKAAQEVGYDFSGVDKPKNENSYYGIRYAEFTVPLVKAVQELNSKNDSLELRVLELENRIKKLEKLTESK